MSVSKGKEYNEDLEDYIMVDVLGFCGCGSPDTILRNLERYLDIVEKRKYPKSDGLLVYAYVADAAKLTDHGGSVYGAWLTDKGEKVLRLLRENAIPSDEELGGNYEPE